MNKKFTNAQIKELKQLKRDITSSHKSTDALVQSSKDKSREALAEAILCGKKLARVKEIIGFGGFERWLKENCKEISKTTVQRYMSLHNSFGGDKSHVNDLSPMSLRKAYIKLGIIDEVSDEVSNGSGTHMEVNIATGKTVITDLSIPQSPSPSPSKPTHLSKLAGHTTATPTINQNDVLSRVKYLMDELEVDLINKIQSKSLSRADAKRHTLTRLQKFFNGLS